MLEPSKLPAGVHVEANADEQTVDVVNRLPHPFEIADGIIIPPGGRVTFYKGERIDCTVTVNAPRCPPR